VRRALLAAALCCLAGAACRTPLPPEATLLSEDDPRPARLLAQLAERAHGLAAVRGTARVSVDGQQGASFARQLVLVARPANLRVEVLGVLNQRIAVLATDGERYDLYRSEDGSVESGAVHPAVLVEVAGVPLAPEQAVALLLGAPAEAWEAARAQRALELGEGAIRVELAPAADGLERSLDFAADGSLRRYAVQAGGQSALEVRWDDYRDLPGGRFAHRIAVEFPDVAARAEVSFRSVELNPALPAELFRLELAGRASG
jgi:hypothetical protein